MKIKLLFRGLIQLALYVCISAAAIAGPSAITLDNHLVNPGRILFKPTAGDNSAASIEQRARNILGADIRVEYFSQVGIGVVKLAKPTDPKTLKDLIAKLAADPGIAYAEPDSRLSVDTPAANPSLVPNDPLYPQLWGMHRIGAEIAWETTTDSNGIVVGVIDTGVDYNHEDLSGNMWTNPGEIPGNGLDDDGNGYIDDIYGIDCANDDSDPWDDHEHGSHCAGTIGGVGNNGVGVAGVNWNTQIMALKFLDSGGSGWSSDAVECLNYAVDMKQRGVDVRLTSNSWGGGPYEQSLYDAIAASGQEDMLFVAAAGNDYGNNNDISPSYPASYDLPNIVAVASIDEFDGLSNFSNFGPTSVDLGAPGSNITSTIPGNGYASFNGTSMATPHVAGALALLWGDRLTDSSLSIKSSMMGSVDPLPSLQDRVVSNGVLNVGTAIGCDPGQPTLVTSLADGFEVETGQAQVLTARLFDCSNLTGAAGLVLFDNGDAEISLRDDGVAPDVMANDGILSGLWNPSNIGTVSVEFVVTLDEEQYSQRLTGQVLEFQGYYFDDAHNFQWEDISQTGTPLSLSDDSDATVNSPFPVQFYGASHDHITVGSNGYISFSDQYLGYGNAAIPVDGAGAFAALLWDDLNPSTGGTVFWEVRGSAPNRRLIVQFQDVPHYFTTDASSFQVVFYEGTEDILVQYLDVDFGDSGLNQGASATVGMQRDGAYGQQYSYNSPVLANESAILWTRGAPASSLPIPDIKVNGADTVQIVPAGQPVLVEFSLDPNGYVGLADQKLVALRGSRELVRFDRTSLVRPSSGTAFNSVFPSGGYWMIYGIDTQPDGVQTYEVYDAVPVWVRPVGATAADMPDFEGMFKRWLARDR